LPQRSLERVLRNRELGKVADIESNIWAQRCLKAGDRSAASQQQ